MNDSANLTPLARMQQALKTATDKAEHLRVENALWKHYINEWEAARRAHDEAVSTMHGAEADADKAQREYNDAIAELYSVIEEEFPV